MNKTIAILTGVACLALGQSVAQAAEITFAAYTNGCFGVGCTPLNTSAAGGGCDSGSDLLQHDLRGHVVFRGACGESRDLRPGSARERQLRGRCVQPADYFYRAVRHRRRIHVHIYVGAFGHDERRPRSVQSQSGPMRRGRDQLRRRAAAVHLQRTTGLFQFSVNDLTVLAGQTAQLTGNITDAYQTTTTTTQSVPPVPVPEPTSLVLLGTGLLAVARRVRRTHVRRDQVVAVSR